MVKGNGDHACRRHPPQVVVMPMMSKITKNVSAQVVSVYPPVNPDLVSCGDFSLKIEARTEDN